MKNKMMIRNENRLTKLYENISKYKTVQDREYTFVPDERYFHLIDFNIRS